MRARIIDKETLQSISPAEISAYLRSKGGAKVDEIPQKTGIWQYGTDELVIPVSTRFADYALRISQALQQIEEIEQRSQLMILDDIKHIAFDVIRVRNVSNDTKCGTLNFAKSVDFVAHTRDMILAAACSAATHKQHYPSRKPQNAERFMNNVRFGKTEQGSFVLTLLSPVTPDLSTQGTLLHIPEEPPYEKTVIPTLNSGLNALNQAAIQASEDREMIHFVEATEQGVTTNLCDAITNLYEKLTPDFIEVSIAFSGNRKASLPISKISIDSGYIPIIKEASEKIKSNSPEPEQTVRGFITNLGSPDPQESGEVTIQDVISPKPRKIIVWLTGDEYRRAGEAHFGTKPVEIAGTVTRKGRTFGLENPSSLTILETE